MALSYARASAMAGSSRSVLIMPLSAFSSGSLIHRGP